LLTSSSHIARRTPRSLLYCENSLFCLAESQKPFAPGTIYVKYSANNEVDLATHLPTGSPVKLRLPKKNPWKAVNYTFHLSAQLARFVAALVAASSTDRTDRWTEWADWSACSVSDCGKPGLRTRHRVCVSTTGASCTPGTLYQRVVHLKI